MAAGTVQDPISCHEAEDNILQFKRIVLICKVSRINRVNYGRSSVKNEILGQWIRVQQPGIVMFGRQAAYLMKSTAEPID